MLKGNKVLAMGRKKVMKNKCKKGKLFEGSIMVEIKLESKIDDLIIPAESTTILIVGFLRGHWLGHLP